MEKLEQIVSIIKLEHTTIEKLNLELISQPAPGTTGSASFNATALVFRPEDADPDKVTMFKVVINANSKGKTSPDKKEADLFTLDMSFAGFYSVLDGKTVKIEDVKKASSLIGNQLTPLVYHMISDLLLKMGLGMVTLTLNMLYLHPPVPVVVEQGGAKKKAVKKKKTSAKAKRK